MTGLLKACWYVYREYGLLAALRSFRCGWIWGRIARNRKRKFNLPGDRIHDVRSSYGRLLLPLARGRWIAWFDWYGLRLTWHLGFHNCTRSGKK